MSRTNRWTFDGEITRDPFYGKAHDGKQAYLKAPAKNEVVNQRGEVVRTDYMTLVFFSDSADEFAPQLTQGTKFYAEGFRPGTETYKDKSTGEMRSGLTAVYDRFASGLYILGQDAELVSRPINVETGYPAEQTVEEEAAPAPRSAARPAAARPVLAPRNGAAPNRRPAAAPAPRAGATMFEGEEEDEGDIPF
jgi:single-stranded DNA-binding protein